MKEDRRLRKNPRTGNKDHYTHKNIRHGQFRGRADINYECVAKPATRPCSIRASCKNETRPTRTLSAPRLYTQRATIVRVLYCEITLG